MGTRSNYRVIETWKQTEEEITAGKKPVKNVLVNVSVQYDGYPDGHPLETMEWLASGKVVNGLTMTGTDVIFNGAGCLAAQLIKRLKDGPGGTYIHPIKDFGLCGENYMYDIIVNSDTKEIKIIAYDNYSGKKLKTKTLFKGTPQEYVDKYTKKE